MGWQSAIGAGEVGRAGLVDWCSLWIPGIGYVAASAILDNPKTENRADQALGARIRPAT